MPIRLPIKRVDGDNFALIRCSAAPAGGVGGGYRGVVDEALEPKAGAARLRAAASRLPVQAEQTVGEVVRLLAAVVARLRVPLLVVAAAPVLPALVLVVATALRGGSDVPLAYLVAALLLVPSGGLELRRRQLLAALRPPAQAGAEIYAIVGSPELLVQLRTTVGQLGDLGRAVGLRPLARKLWRGIKLTNTLRTRIGANRRLAPFLPGRLRGLLLLAAGCGVAGALLTVLAVVKVATAAVGIG